MKKKYLIWMAVVAAGFGIALLPGQDAGITGVIRAGGKTRIAVPDFRGKGAAQPLMNTFNETLWNDLADAGSLELVSKSFYPVEVPQTVADFKPPTVTGGQTVRNGPWLTDWSRPPVSTDYLAIGQADVNATGLLLQGALFNVGQAELRTAQVFASPYFGTPNEEGARTVAHQFAADILKRLGIPSLTGTKIYFVSDRTGNQEIWSMDHDGANQRRMTRHDSFTFMPTVSADGKLVAYATKTTSRWELRVVAAETGRTQNFYNPETSTLYTPEFSPDGQKLWFSMVIDGFTQIAVANVNGGEMRRVSKNRAIELEARVNPKTGTDVVFISDRTGHSQIYRMNIDGTGVEMLTNGLGQAHNPAWSPDGTKIAFAWTSGFVAGDFNIFIMDVATKMVGVQLTHESGTNENPTWAPDGLHIVFSNQKGRSTQIYTMLANGTRVKPLTAGDVNKQPVWAKGTN